MSQEAATRIGVCLNDFEMFWWRADNGEACPVCSTDDEDYEAQHRFYALAAEVERRREGEQWLAEHVEGLTAEVERLRTVIEDCMWNGYAWIGTMPCVCCGGEEPRHHDGCALQAALDTSNSRSRDEQA